MADHHETLLALDIGNTHIVLGIYSGESLLIRRRLATESGRTSDEAGILIKMLCRDGGVDPASINAVAIASVAPKAGMVFGEMAENYLACKPLFIHGEIPGFDNRYRNPRAVGADRVCDAVAGFAKYGGPLLVLDFGTAITIDIIDKDGAYLGGVILPGLATSAEALHLRAALLPSVHLKMPKEIIGTTTDESIRIGLMRGAVGAIRGLIRDICDSFGCETMQVVATGGMASVMAPHLPEVNAIEPDLVLDGIRMIYEKSKNW
ncbi:type III pantothenate kinase [bacterium]|nr:type III pantothenate kinase [bacterium]